MPLHCRKCLKPAQCNLEHIGPRCKSCFCSQIEKRIRKDIRIHEYFKNGDSVIVKGVLSQHFIKKILNKLPLNINPMNNNNKGTQIIVYDYSLTDSVCDFLTKAMTNKSTAKSKGISILTTVMDKELLTYASMQGLVYTPNKKNIEIIKFIEQLEKEYPDITFGIAKGMQYYSSSSSSSSL